MKAVADIIPSAMEQDNTITCNTCGSKIEFAENQWRRPCGKCGTIITQPRIRLILAEKEKPVPRCFICYDHGVVYYKEQIGGISYDYAARCYCRAGETSEKTAFPRVDEVGNIANLQWLEMRNRQEWEKRTGKKVDPALLRHSQEVEVNPEEIPF